MRLFLLAVTAVAVLAQGSESLAADTLYDMRSTFNQPHPFAASARAPAPPAYAPPPVYTPPAQTYAPVSTPSLNMPYGPSPYYMPNLSGMPSPSAPAAPAAAPPASYSAGSGKAYDMDMFLNQRHPFEAGRFEPVRMAAPKPVQTLAPEPVPAQAPQAAPLPAADDDFEDMGVDDVAEEDGTNDPLEPMNRFFFGFNEYLQDFLLRPVANVYNEWLPTEVRTSIGSFLDNINSPVVLANDILQFEPYRAMETGSRILINTSLGLGGFFDVAEHMGIKGHSEDFGQTLAVWGVGEWFYIVLPVFGPSNPRDAAGKMLVDSYFSPMSYWLKNTDRDGLSWTLTGLSGVEEYASVVKELDQIKSTSIDYYAAIRSMYRQKRESEIVNGEDAGLMSIPDLYDELEGIE